MFNNSLTPDRHDQFENITKITQFCVLVINVLLMIFRVIRVMWNRHNADMIKCLKWSHVHWMLFALHSGLKS